MKSQSKSWRIAPSEVGTFCFRSSGCRALRVRRLAGFARSLANTTDPTHDQTTYGYDAVGDQTSESQTSGSTVYTTTTAYNADGVKVTSICAPPGGYMTGLVSGAIMGNLSGSWTGGYGQSVSGTFNGTVSDILNTPAGDALVSGTVKDTISGSQSSQGVLTGSYTGTGALTITGALSGTINITISGTAKDETTNPENPTSGTLTGGLDASASGQINNSGQVTNPTINGTGLVSFDLPNSQDFGTASGSFSGQEVGPSTNYKYDPAGNLLSQSGPGTCGGVGMGFG